MICYHHNDLDGKCAGYLVHHLRSGTLDYPENYYSTTYEDKLDKHSIKDDVFIVDISISEKTYPMFIEVCKTAKSVTWIDHHKTSLEVIDKHKAELQAQDNLTYFVSESACGAALVYSYFNINPAQLTQVRSIDKGQEYSINAKYLNGGIIDITAIKTDHKNVKNTWIHHCKVTLPKWLFHIDDYDSWKRITEDSNRFVLGVNSIDTSVKIFDKQNRRYNFNPFWDELTNNNNCENIDKYIQDGAVIDNYIHSIYKSELCDTFEWVFDNTTFICKNGTGNSFNFENLINNYAAAILFNYSGKSGKWEYSVYSGEKSDFDCSVFCSKFGGGGHIHASGFSTDKLIFTHNINNKSNGKQN